MLKRKEGGNTELAPHTFQKFNKSILYNAAIPPDKFMLLKNDAANFITLAELASDLHHHFKENKSSGLSKMPLQVLKHLGPTGIACMTTFLNDSAIK